MGRSWNGRRARVLLERDVWDTRIAELALAEPASRRHDLQIPRVGLQNWFRGVCQHVKGGCHNMRLLRQVFDAMDSLAMTSDNMQTVEIVKLE